MILNETQEAIRDSVRAFAQERLRPESMRFEAAKGYPDWVFSELASLGMTAPDSVGGAEADMVSYALALIELAAADGALSTIVTETDADSDASAIRTKAEKVEGGWRINGDQAVGFRLADLAAKLEAARHLVLHAASLKEARRPCLTEASMAKLVASETAETVVSGAIQTLGGYGYLEEFGLAKIYRDVRVCQIYEGTSDIQRMVISRAL